MNGTGGDQGIATESNYIGSDRTALDVFNNSVTTEDRWQTHNQYGGASFLNLQKNNNINT